MKIWQSIRLYSNLLYFQLTTTSPRNYRQQWNSFWGDTNVTGQQGTVLWDVDPEQASQIDLQRFKSYMNPELPLLDLGCGNGRQSRFLTQHFSQVIGADVSEAAIELAQKESGGQENLIFRTLDGTDISQVTALHDEFGDMNIYIRGVVHVIQKSDRADFTRGLRTLLGTQGVLYQTELDKEALPYFRQFPGDTQSGLPALLERVIQHGITPIGFELKKLHEIYLPDLWEILAKGQGAKMNTIELAPQQHGAVPANFLVARPQFNST
ncbi:MAG: class I SAM-dependent methyltransferase [Chloroflexota bacterium]